MGNRDVRARRGRETNSEPLDEIGVTTRRYGESRSISHDPSGWRV